MLLRVASLNAYKLRGLDGDIGAVQRFYFDDQCWTIRYLAAATGNWLGDKQLLISPHALAGVATDRREIAVALTKEQIEAGPLLPREKTLSQEFESSYFEFFRWPVYWSGPHQWGAHPYIVRDQQRKRAAGSRVKGWTPRLHSIDEMTRHHIQAPDGDVGRIVDFLVDDDTWEIRYFIIARRDWWLQRHVLVAPEWIKQVSWETSKVYVDLSRGQVRRSPAFSANTPLTRADEIRLHRHYRRLGYWDEQPDFAAHDGW
jgi:hypothetical protein